MDSILIAIHQTVPYGQAKKLADSIGMSQKILSNKVNPDNEHHHLHVVELVRLMKAADDYQALRAIADSCGFRLEKKVAAKNGTDIIAVLLDVEAEHGDVARKLADALADGRLTPREKVQVVKEIDEAIEALFNLKQCALSYGEPK